MRRSARGCRLIHVRHEAAAVHMADAWGRLTGQCGIVLGQRRRRFHQCGGGPVHGAGGESPLVLLSGHAGPKEVGRGAFQELRQADMAEPVTKASWVARSTATLGHGAGRSRAHRAVRPPGTGASQSAVRPAGGEDADQPRCGRAARFCSAGPAARRTAAASILAALAEAARPLVLAGPQLCHGGDLSRAGQPRGELGVPVVPMESPRGINDPRLGAFAEVLRQADLIVLLGKAHDFTLRFGDPPFVDAACRFIAIDADAAMIERAKREKGERLAFNAIADARPAAQALIAGASGARHANAGWLSEVHGAIAYRPPAWDTLTSREPGKVHPVELCRALQPAFAQRPMPSSSATAARSGNGRRRCWRRHAASSTDPPAPSAPPFRSPSPPAPPLPMPRHRRDGRRHLRFPHGRVRHRRALQPAVRRRGRQ